MKGNQIPDQDPAWFSLTLLTPFLTAGRWFSCDQRTVGSVGRQWDGCANSWLHGKDGTSWAGHRGSIRGSDCPGPSSVSRLEPTTEPLQPVRSIHRQIPHPMPYRSFNCCSDFMLRVKTCLSEPVPRGEEVESHNTIFISQVRTSGLFSALSFVQRGLSCSNLRCACQAPSILRLLS